MLLTECLLIIFSLFIAEHGTDDTNNVTEINRYQNTTNFNTTSEHLILKGHMKRRSVLIINNGTNLRSFEKSSKKATSLLYEEYADDGVKINTVMMYSLDDVSAFFRTYLNTEICNVKCGDDDD